jgi:hypothetical protein
MHLVDEVKQFFWLRRIALATERQADAFDKLIKFLESEAQHPKPPKRKSEFSLMDQEAINKDFERRVQAEHDGIELED